MIEDWYLMYPCTAEQFKRFKKPDNDVTAAKVQKLQAEA